MEFIDLDISQERNAIVAREGTFCLRFDIMDEDSGQPLSVIATKIEYHIKDGDTIIKKLVPGNGLTVEPDGDISINLKKTYLKKRGYTHILWIETEDDNYPYIKGSLIIQ